MPFSTKNVHLSPGAWRVIPTRGGLPYKKDGGGWSSEILKRTPKRYQDPVFWAWFKLFSPLRGISSYFFSAQYRKRYCKSSRCKPFKAEHPNFYQNRFFNPSKELQAPPHFYMGFPPPGGIFHEVRTEEKVMRSLKALTASGVWGHDPRKVLFLGARNAISHVFQGTGFVNQNICKNVDYLTTNMSLILWAD